MGKTFEEIAKPVRLKVKKAKLKRKDVKKAISGYREKITKEQYLQGLKNADEIL